jgi:ankyrin repeat protein
LVSTDSGNYGIGNYYTYPFRPGCPLLSSYKVRNHSSGVEFICKLHNPIKYRSTPAEPATLVESICEWELSPGLKLTGLGKAFNLINKGYNLNERDNQGRTPLMLAIRFGFSDLANLLIDKGADITLKDNNTMSAMQYALRSDSSTFLFFDKELNNQDFKKGWTLYNKTYLSNLKQFKELFRLPGVYNQILLSPLDGKTPSVPVSLEHLIEFSNQIALKLISHGADINCKCPNGRTLLMEGVFLNNTGVVDALINKGADVNAKDEQNCTALTIARYFRFDEIAGILAKAGAKE